MQKRNEKKIIKETLFWLFSGIIFIMFLLLSVWYINGTREKDYPLLFLGEKGSTILSTVEFFYQSALNDNKQKVDEIEQGEYPSRLQFFLKEIVDGEGILFLALVDEDGKVLIDTNNYKKGDIFLNPLEIAFLEPQNEIRWMLAEEDGKEIFIMYKHLHLHAPRSSENSLLAGVSENELLTDLSDHEIAFIGLDASALLLAQKEQERQSKMMYLLVLIFSITAYVAIFLSVRVRVSRRAFLESKALSEEILSSLPEAIIMLGMQGEVNSINDFAKEMFGLKSSIDKLEDLPYLFQDAYFKAENNEFMIDELTESHLSNGESLPVSFSSSCIITDDEVKIGYLFIVRDMREIRKLQDALQRREKLVAIGNLAAGVAHEIRNPLSSIKGYAMYFKTYFKDDSDEAQAAQIMVQEVDRLNRVITELIGLSSPSAVELGEISLYVVCEQIQQLLRHDFEQKGIAFSLALDNNLPALFADADRLQQVFLNVSLNAVQAMPKGGKFSIHAKYIEDKEQVCIEFIDTGEGISAENLRKIFDPYFTTKGDGTGLGLCVVQKVIEAHAGTIRVYNNISSGVVVEICLPSKKRK